MKVFEDSGLNSASPKFELIKGLPTIQKNREATKFPDFKSPDPF